MKPPRPLVGRVALLGAVLVLVGVLVRLSLPLWGTSLAVADPLQPGDVALVLEGTGKDGIDVAEGWRQQGLVHDVVVVEAPIRTHALVAYWSDFVRWGLAPAPTTPPEHLQVVRAPSTQAGEQARAALPALPGGPGQVVLVPGGGGIGSRLVEQQLAAVLSPHGISVRLVRQGTAGPDPGTWYRDASDRRAVLDTWLQVLVPFLGDYEPSAGS